ncbi:hypothetical protein E0I61_09465 [Flavobacterium ranwuense]|uniref:DUF4365 domain-containing protein n=1 Tax=Flavobacterium ranwuense TaxID=2541725 RepID=A0ABY2DUK9_9FLAO|nr:hypothetical protein [Flavobacterium ranwuense]TDE29378.1 hypothetical protein E0I61_09465 [Flavobacterium ranwuense]
MNDTESLLTKHTVGPQTIGFDYQFYYFIYLSLNLKFGEKIGFEVKEDIHIDVADGTTVLLQMKHSVLQNAAGQIQNLTSLDSDLWKTLSNWSDFIKVDKNNTDNFLNKHIFILVTNKNHWDNNFIDALEIFKTDLDLDKLLDILSALEAKTQDTILKSYIKNVRTLGKKRCKSFFKKLGIETGVDDIIQKIKNKILENVKQHKFIDPVFESLSSNMYLAKFTDIKDRKKFEISFDDFNIRFGKCFQVAFVTGSLPQRNLPVLLPENLEEQIFIKQLIDIGEVDSGSIYIRDYTTQMLKFLNDFTYWSEESFLLPMDVESFKQNSIQTWLNEFKVKYRNIEKRIKLGENLNDLEEDIKSMGLEIVDYVKRQNLPIPGFAALGLESSNGHYYVLSDKLEIGWHLDWKEKYKKL